jgi:hypothetical protein
MREILHVIVLLIWSGVHAHPNPAIEDAIVTAAMEDAARGYVDSAFEAAALAFWSAKESGNEENPKAQSRDAAAGQSCGPWQEECATLPRTLLGQARKWLWLAHRGAAICPESPLAPLSGGCRAGRVIAETRLHRMREILNGRSTDAIALRGLRSQAPSE